MKNYDYERPETSRSRNLVRDLINPPRDIPSNKFTELLSPMHYVKNVCYDGKRTYEGIPLNLTNTFIQLDDSRRRITRETPSRKFSLDEFKLGWERLKEFGLLNKKHFNFPASPIFTACWLAHDLYGGLVTRPEGLKLLEWNEALTSK